VRLGGLGGWPVTLVIYFNYAVPLDKPELALPAPSYWSRREMGVMRIEGVAAKLTYERPNSATNSPRRRPGGRLAAV
jgi:hypothetical protein